MKRSGKFYYRNEKETLKKLGLQPVPGSGSGWIHKEDGEDENVMVQLKSTDASSYRVDMLDIKKLEYHAQVSNKLPIFLIQFLQQDKIYALVNVEDLYKVSRLQSEPKQPKQKPLILVENEPERKKIKSTKKSREEFFKERSEGYGKRK